MLLALATAQEPFLRPSLLQRQQRANLVHLAKAAKHLSHSRKSSSSSSSSSSRPCNCAAFDDAWQAPSRKLPKCIFLDLGAADGNTYHSFLQDKFGPVANCGTTENPGDFEAFLVEANPVFDAPLQQLSDTGNGQVHAMKSTAAYMCDASTTFWLDNDVNHNYWGSSMDGKTHNWPEEASDTSNGVRMPQVGQVRAAAQDGHKVTVPTVNLMKVIYENTIPGDWLIVKMDIEGAEWDIVPCLANSPVATLIDQLYVEEHPIHWQLGNTTREEMDLARQTLTEWGIQMPQYWSPTL